MANTVFDIPIAVWSDSLYSNYLMIHNLNESETASTKLIGLNDLYSGSIGFNNRLMSDFSQVQSLSWGGRYMFDNLGSASLDWSSRTLHRDNGSPSLNWQYCTLNDNSGNVSINWNQYVLKASSGNQATVDWNQRRLIKSDGSIAFDWQNTPLRICKTAVLKITQSGTSNPTVLNVVVDELVLGVITCFRNNTGEYVLQFSSSFNADRTFVTGNLISGRHDFIFTGISLIIFSRDNSGNQADNILNGFIKIEYYN